MPVLRPDAIIRAIAAGLLLAAVCLPVAADELKSKLDAVQRDLERKLSDKATFEEKAKAAEADIRSLKHHAVDLARQLHERSATIDRLERRLKSLENDEAEKASRLSQRRGELIATLGALQRIARLPAATLVAMPRPPDETIRSAILLRSAVPELRREARRLSTELDELATLRGAIRRDRTRLDRALSGLEGERQKLASLSARKMTLLQSTRNAEREAARAAAALSAQAVTLRDLLERLSRSPNSASRTENGTAPAPGLGPGPEAPSRVVRLKEPAHERTLELRPEPGGMPAPGRIVHAFGEKLPNGLLSRGVSIATRPSAAVVAPRPGRVVFAGNFRGYGNLVILELPDREHALIAGLGKIEAEIGDEVLAGEPLGEMTPSTNDAPTLYFEVRRRGQPINPLPSSAALKTR